MPKAAAKPAPKPSKRPRGSVSEPAAPASTKPLRGGLAKLHTPSVNLAAVIGAEPLTRSAATARLWDHIRAHGLQDPADRRTIIADDKLRPLFERDRVGMFELTGILGRHLTAA